MAFKMKGSPLHRNFGLGKSPAKQKLDVEKKSAEMGTTEKKSEEVTQKQLGKVGDAREKQKDTSRGPNPDSPTPQTKDTIKGDVKKEGARTLTKNLKTKDPEVKKEPGKGDEDTIKGDVGEPPRPLKQKTPLKAVDPTEAEEKYPPNHPKRKKERHIYMPKDPEGRAREEEQRSDNWEKFDEVYPPRSISKDDSYGAEELKKIKEREAEMDLSGLKRKSPAKYMGDYVVSGKGGTITQIPEGMTDEELDEMFPNRSKIIKTGQSEMNEWKKQNPNASHQEIIDRRNKLRKGLSESHDLTEANPGWDQEEMNELWKMDKQIQNKINRGEEHLLTNEEKKWKRNMDRNLLRQNRETQHQRNERIKRNRRREIEDSE